MIKITKQVDYALQFISALGRLDQGTHQGLKHYANEAGVSFLFMQKIARQLRLAGLINANHGAQGGYALARPLGKISLFAVMEAVEGPVGITACTRGQVCAKEGHCSTEAQLKILNERIVLGMQAVSLVSFAAKNI